jgi:two-component system, chemotaxis family, protein-glutamate methylesterase/glutaminase
VRSPEQSSARSVVADGVRSPLPDAAPTFPVVALVSSAAASETVARVLAPLPAAFPGAVIVMHAGPPNADNRQAQVLAERIQLPVSLARAGSPLCPGEVLLLPSGRQPLVGTDQRVRLVDVYSVPSNRPPVSQLPSADLLLHTLAVALGPRAVAVLLSGARHPGTRGAQAVNHHGGRSLVRGGPTETRPAAALEAGRPPSPPLTLDAIPPLLVKLCGRAQPSEVL